MSGVSGDYFPNEKPCCNSAVYHANPAGPRAYWTCEVHDRIRKLEAELAEVRANRDAAEKRVSELWVRVHAEDGGVTEPGRTSAPAERLSAGSNPAPSTAYHSAMSHSDYYYATHCNCADNVIRKLETELARYRDQNGPTIFGVGDEGYVRDLWRRYQEASARTAELSEAVEQLLEGTWKSREHYLALLRKGRE